MTLSQVGFLTLASSSKVTVYNSGDARDIGLIPVFGRSPEGGHGNPLQYSCLENPMDRGGAWWAIVRGAEEFDMTEQLHFFFTFGSPLPRIYRSRITRSQDAWDPT